MTPLLRIRASGRYNRCSKSSLYSDAFGMYVWAALCRRARVFHLHEHRRRRLHGAPARLQPEKARLLVAPLEHELVGRVRTRWLGLALRPARQAWRRGSENPSHSSHLLALVRGGGTAETHNARR